MICSKCNHNLPDDSEFCQYCGNKIDVAIETENEIVNEIIETPAVFEMPRQEIETVSEQITQKTNSKKIKIRFCKMCGSQIDSQTKKCTGCGKQYFKGFKFANASFLWVALLVISVIFNIVQYEEKGKGYEDLEYYKRAANKYYEESKDLSSELHTIKEGFKGYKDYAALNHFNDDKRYHLLGCDDLPGYYWIYTIEEAEEKGYYACTKCH